jgi:hypothetical protein
MAEQSANGNRRGSKKPQQDCTELGARIDAGRPGRPKRRDYFGASTMTI